MDGLGVTSTRPGAWFAISDALPGLSTSAERAARQILDACRHGDPELTITLPARIAVAANHLVPAAVAHILALANRALPGPTGTGGDRHHRGRESQSRWAPSAATALNDGAAASNNQV